MDILKKDIKLFKLNIDVMSLIAGILIFFAMLLFGLLKVAYDIRGVTLIFGRGNNEPQWFAITIFCTMLLIGLTLFTNIVLRNLAINGKKNELYISSIISIIVVLMGILTLLATEMMDGNVFNSTEGLGFGAIISGSLLIIAGILLFLRFNIETIKLIVSLINGKKGKNKKTTNADLMLEIEKLGTLITVGLQISKNDKVIIDIINFYWNLNQLTVQLNITEAEKTKLNRENDRMMRYIKNLNLEVNDYVNRVYNNMNLEILTFETNSELTDRIIIKTIEPEIRYNNIIIQRSKVVIAGPEMTLEA